MYMKGKGDLCMASQVAVIKALVKSLVESGATSSTGDAALTPFLRTLKIDNYSTLVDKFYSAKSGYSTQDFLEQVCGVRRNNTDTGAITGSDAGGSVTKTTESIIPESSTAKELSSAEYNSFTKNGLTVNITYDEPSSVGSTYNYEVDNYIAQQKLVVKKLYNWWIPEALDLINQSLGINFSDGRANCTTLDIKFTDDSYSGTIDWNDTTDMGKSSTMSMTINMNKLSGLTESDKNGTLSSAENDNYLSTTYLDRILVQNLVVLALRANIPYFYNLPAGIRYGLQFIVGGYDDSTYSDYSYDYLDNNNNASAYTFMRWFAKNYADKVTDTGSDSDGLKYNTARTAVTITSDYSGTELEDDDYDSTVVTITGASLSTGLEIEGNSKANVIVGTKGADTIDGGSGNDTLTGGAGADVFLYESGEGNDVITDYTAGQDSISIDGGAVSAATANGSNVVLTIGRNSLTLKNAANKNITISDNQGEFTTLVSGSSSSDTSSSGGSSSTVLTITNSTKSPVTMSSSYITANAKSRSTAVSITGNSKANSIVGGKGADTLNGGSGNDTLTGGNGKDVFVYASGGGKDVITDYTANQDSIRVTSGSITNASLSGSDVVLKVGSGSITVKNGQGKSLTLVNSSGRSSTTVVGGSSSSTSSGSSSLADGLSYANSNKTLNVKSPFTGTLNVSNYASTVNTINASTDNKFITIKGTSRAENIKAGTRGSSIVGGKGNDTLTGGRGADIFSYASGDGKDVIVNFAPDYDSIKITSGSISKASVSGSDVVLTVGSGSITVKNAKSKDINISDSSGETKTYNFSSGSISNPTKSFEERWFLEISNCTMQNAELDSIIDDKSNEISIDYKFNEDNKLLQKSNIILADNKQLKK